MRAILYFPRMARRWNAAPPDFADSGSLFAKFQQLPAPLQLMVVALIVIAAIAFYVAYERASRPPAGAPGAAVTPNLVLGNPSNARESFTSPDNFLMDKGFFVLSYNNALGRPNWVSWTVTLSDLGNAPRKQVFDPDATLPPGFTQVTTHDYSGSGFDRGHMCPHSDRAASEQMSFATFVMTNIIPQAPNVNRKAWEQLESYGRELVSREHDRLYIISGPAGEGGNGSRGFAASIGHGKVRVPAACWKIIVAVPDQGIDDPSAIDASSRVISVLMPNDQDKVGEEWAGFRVSPAAIEQETGYHFFDRLSPQVADALRQKVDDLPIPPPQPHRHAAE